MKSIRLSLVVYFLVLLAAALGTVFTLVYRTAAAALDERRHGSQRLVEAQYQAQCNELRAALDDRLRRQAQTVARAARPPLHFEGLYPLGVMGVPLVSAPHLNTGLWLFEGIPTPRTPEREPSLADMLFRQRAGDIDIDEADEDLIAASQRPDNAHEFFQVFSAKGKPMKRSKSLGAQPLPLNGKILNDDRLQVDYDTIRLEGSGHTVRRVSLRASLSRFRVGGFPPGMWRRPGPPGKTVGAGKGPGPGGPAWPSGEFGAPVIFVEYAIDTAPTEARLQQFADERAQQLAQVEADTHSQLQALRGQFVWIALVTFAATVAGGYVLLRLGLSPLARLSEAVSEVSERDFRLKVDPSQLPSELQPIAERLSHTLEQLGKAFDREKQAAADISHELRTPLAALLTNIEVALRKSRTAQEYREILDECQSSGRQMSHLVERLLALARLDAGAERSRPRAVDAADLALQCAELIRPLATARDLSLTAHATPPLLVEVDSDKLREVVTNLLHNAVEYNRPGGSIELDVHRNGGDLCVEVRDTGIGIAPEARARIFERFYRVDPSRHADTPHAGLGLAIVKSYVDLLGGTISVESAPQQGTTFRVHLPVKEPAAEEKLVLT